MDTRTGRAPHAPGGPLALIIQPDGATTAERLPENPLATYAAITEAIGGGAYEAIVGPGGWVAYQSTNGRRVNMQADAIARAAGWHPEPSEHAKGTAVFLGRSGGDEADVPENVLQPGPRGGPDPQPPRSYTVTDGHTDPRWASVAEAHEYLRGQVSERTLRRWIADERVPLTGHRLGPRRIQIDLNELDRLRAPIQHATTRERDAKAS